MDAPNQPSQDGARQVIRDYLTAAGRTASALAHQAQINRSILSKWLAGRAELSTGSALKLYMAIEPGLENQGRQVYVQGCGLPATLISGPLPQSQGVHAIPSTVPLGEAAGHYWMVLGNQAIFRSWSEAIPFYRAAEMTFGPASSAAAMASCFIAEIYMNLGDYAMAQQEFSHLERTYARVMDPHTATHAYHARGMLCYYLGDLPQAEEWFQRSLKLAEDWQLVHDVWNAKHFLGRVYTAWGSALALAHDPRAGQLFSRAETQLEAARAGHAKVGNDIGMGFNLLRQAQLRWAEGCQPGVEGLLKKARQAGGATLLAYHAELAEAELDQENGDAHVSSAKAGHALEAFSEIAYAKGMGDALRLLGISEQMQGRLDRTLMWYIASLCVFPNAQSLPTAGLMADVAALRDSLRAEQGAQGYRRTVQHIRQMIENRQGAFACLSHVAVDRSADIARVLAMLEQATGVPRSSEP